MRIALMTDIPDQPVIGRVEDVVDRDRQLDDAKARAQVTAGARNRVDHLRADFRCEIRQQTVSKFAQFSDVVDAVEDRRMQSVGSHVINPFCWPGITEIWCRPQANSLSYMQRWR